MIKDFIIFTDEFNSSILVYIICNGNLMCFQYNYLNIGDDWKMAFEPFNAVIGKNGFATAGEKREGDGKTPSGIFALQMTFGYDD